MNDKIFADTNVLLYLFDNDGNKKNIAKKILKSSPIISVQICNELSNVLLKKFKFDEAYRKRGTIRKQINMIDKEFKEFLPNINIK